MFFLYPWLQNLDKPSFARTFQTLLCISIVIAVVGALNPWSPLIYSENSFMANIEQFITHLRHPTAYQPSAL